MQRYDEIVAICLEGGVENNARGDGVYVAVHLSKNDDLCNYHRAYAAEDDAVNAILGEDSDDFDEREEQHGVLSDGDLVLVDVGDIRGKNIENKNVFVPAKMGECTLHESETHSIQSGDSCLHYYFLRACEDKLKCLSVTVVLSGKFDGPTYIPGQLTMDLRRLSKTEDEVVLGSTKSTSTVDAIGCGVINYNAERNAVIKSGLFAVSVTAQSDANYSITLGGAFCRRLDMELKREMACVISQRRTTILCKIESKCLNKQMLLLKRKMKIGSRLIEDVRSGVRRSQARIEELDLELDYQDDLEDFGASIVKQIGDLKLESDDAHRLLSIRLKLHESMTNDMKRLEDENNLLQKRMQKTEKGYCTSKEFISAAATRLRGIDSSNMILSMLDLFVMRMAKQQFPTSK